MTNSNQSEALNDLHNYSVDLKSREIFLHNYFGSAEGENPGVEYKMSNMFIKNLRMLELKSYDPIVIHMHSIGGEWADGMAIYDAIRLCNCYISIVCYGQVESMSSIILQSADTRFLTTNSYFMVHYGSSAMIGDYLSAQKWAQYEKHICDTMLDIYSSRCVKGKFFKEKYARPDVVKVKNYLSKVLKDGDWYMTAEDAVHHGFADKLITDWRKLNS